MSLYVAHGPTDEQLRKLTSLLPMFEVGRQGDISTSRGYLVSYWVAMPDLGYLLEQLMEAYGVTAPDDTVVIALDGNTAHTFSSLEVYAVWVQLTQTPRLIHGKRGA